MMSAYSGNTITPFHLQELPLDPLDSGAAYAADPAGVPTLSELFWRLRLDWHTSAAQREAIESDENSMYFQEAFQRVSV